MNIEIAKLLDADIATAVWSKDCYNAREMWFMGKIIEVNPGFRRWMLGFLVMKFQFYITFLRWTIGWCNMWNYERIIFSNEAISAIWKMRSWVRSYYYAHSISRHLFDQYELYLSKVPRFLKPFYAIFASFLRKFYIRELHKVGTIFVNSTENQERMWRLIGRKDAIILSPPVDTDIFGIIDENTLSQTFAIEWISLSIKDYYISFSRLTHAKRIDTIIEAFKQLPDKKVLILFGKNDSQREEFMRLAEWYDNIIFRALGNNENLPHVINGAIASIAISKDEDFGMVAIESMACWVPVIAVDNWWYKETILKGKTGFLLPEDSLIDNLITAIHTLKKEDLIMLKQACLDRSQDFSLENFREKFLHYFK